MQIHDLYRVECRLYQKRKDLAEKRQKFQQRIGTVRPRPPKDGNATATVAAATATTPQPHRTVSSILSEFLQRTKPNTLSSKIELRGSDGQIMPFFLRQKDKIVKDGYFGVRDLPGAVQRAVQVVSERRGIRLDQPFDV